MDNLKEINCKEIFRKAYENRYTWKNDFHGYQGKCIFLTNNNNNIYKGDFILGKDFKPNIQKIEDEKVVKVLPLSYLKCVYIGLRENLNQCTQKIILIYLKILKVVLR